MKTTFLASSTSTHILTGGNYGTVRLWMIPRSQGNSSINNLNAKCLWSIPAFGSKGEGVCDMMALPTESCSDQITPKSSTTKKPLVLLAGSASSLALLDTNKCTRKAFSTTATPTIAASWDLYQLAAREFSKIDSEAKLPARRWMAVHQFSLLRRESTNGDTLFKISMVAKCGWIFIADLSMPSASASNANNQTNSIKLRMRIVHHTPRIQCFNSLNERLTTLGGMALQFSLPDVPIPSSLSCGNGHALQNMIWLGDVKARKYTMPSKDKYILCEAHGTLLSDVASHSSDEATPNTKLRKPGEGLILAHLDSKFFTAPLVDTQGGSGADQEGLRDTSICARVPLSHGSPLSLAVHPSGEWMAVGYGMNGREAATKPLELVSNRTKI